MAIHNIIGKKGEEIAEQFLIKKLYRIADKNWRYKKLELDIVAFHKNCLIIVEVKTRTTEFVENMNELISRKKQRLIIEAANAYLEMNHLENEVRFDVIFIVLSNGKFHLRHIQDAFSPIA